MEASIQMFAGIMKDFRKQIGLNQQDVCDLSNISVGTLRDIENGRVVPKIETLHLLSPAYKHHLIDVFSSCLMGDHKVWFHSMNQMEVKIALEDYTSLSVEREKLKKLLAINKCDFFTIQIQQQIALIDGIMALNLKQKHLQAAHIFTRAIKTSTSLFCFNNYQSHHYSNHEKRLLMNLVLISRFDNKQKGYAREVLEFLLSCTEPSNILYIKLCYHYGLEMLEIGELDRANHHIKKAIQLAYGQNKLYTLCYLGLGKALLMQKQNNADWSNYLQKINNMRMLFGQSAININDESLPIFH